MREPLLLGVDIGTTAVKAALFTPSGMLEATAVRPTPVYTPRPGWFECEMEQLWEVSADAIREVMSRYERSRDRLVAMGLTGNMGGAWLTDERDAPVRPAILWNDSRAGPRVRAWQADGTLARIYARSLSAIGPGFTLPLLLWLRDHEPDALARTCRIAFAKDWIRFRLTGRWATDASEITHVPGDADSAYRTMSLLAEFGLEDLVPYFPSVCEMAEVAGEVCDRAARRTWLKANLPVVTGAGDVTTAVIGMDATAPGRYSVIAGSSCLINLSGAVFEPGEAPSGITFLTPVGLLRSQPNQTGTLLVDWIARVFWGSTGAAVYEQMQEAAASVPPCAGGLLMLPYLNSTGLVAPVYEPAARGQIFGLSLEHDRVHLTRAAYEGLALAVADGIAHLPGGSGTIRMAGGLARSGFWCQLVADTTNKEVLVPAGEELGALGACALAAVAANLYPDLASAQAAMVRTARRYEPDSTRHRFYERALATYQALQQALLPLFRDRDRLIHPPAGEKGDTA